MMIEELLFSISKVNGKKCHMLPAKAVIYDSSNVKLYSERCDQPQSRFSEFVEILSRHELRIKCNIERRMLSPDTTYACFLVFKLSEKCRGLKCPVKARDMLPYKNVERTNIISFTSPNTVNFDKIKWIPNLREDGWMEVIVWETISDTHTGEFIPMDLKLISFEGTMFGLIISGIEFRPIKCTLLDYKGYGSLARQIEEKRDRAVRKQTPTARLPSRAERPSHAVSSLLAP
ncbi:hypothetical protein OSB04_011081 [Centaurea solstitialis]|uniref:Uncharacterized protein n=1 Tax=Centaurea solstitialis TaxID=347529 RepID=A0AA38TRU3_9ASTR|nr:hypothetical protein OSB04_011081 [Centaurea solstitialis]